jgi:hypothetical protein
MKLRIKGNSIRLRLLKSEVEKFGADGRISEQTLFGPTTLSYTLAMSPESEKINAEFGDGEIRIFVPEGAARAWVTNGQVGFEAEQPAGDEVLAILIEKDFVCLDRPDDPDRHDAFPNPNATC